MENSFVLEVSGKNKVEHFGNSYIRTPMGKLVSLKNQNYLEIIANFAIILKFIEWFGNKREHVPTEIFKTST